MSLLERFKNALNVFSKRDPTDLRYTSSIGMASSRRPDKTRMNYGNERSVIAAVYNRVSTDASQIKMMVVKTNENGQYVETLKESGLNEVLNIEANTDQTGRAFKQDIVASLIDEGVIAIVPIYTNKKKNIFTDDITADDIYAMRVGKITTWFPDKVRVSLYDEETGIKREVTLPKSNVAIVENPFYSVMNEPNSTLKRLTKKLIMMDIVDEQSSSGKLDIIIQLPYVIKSDARKAQAEQRRADIEEQLAASKYGIAYTDGTEHITQLNRPAESNLLAQIEYLTNLLFSQLGITKEILEGTASEDVMNNYYERTIEPIVTAITDELTRKFITKTARTQMKCVMAFSDPFKFVPTSKLPDLADKLIRNQILSPNEMRGIVGYKPSDDPSANELRNPNIAQTKEGTNGGTKELTDEDLEAEIDRELEAEGGEKNQNE